MAVAGRVLMIPTGNWTSGTAYGMLDVVIYAGSSYVAKKNISNSTVIPPNDASNWQLLAQGIDVSNIVTKSMIANNFLATDPNTVLSGPMGKSLKDQLDQTNSNLSDKASKSNNNILSAQNTYVFPVGLESSSFNSGLSVKVTAEHSSWARPGIGLVREGVEGVYLYLENKKLYYIDHDGTTHEITST